MMMMMAIILIIVITIIQLSFYLTVHPEVYFKDQIFNNMRYIL